MMKLFGGRAQHSIRDRYETLEEVQADLRRGGLTKAALVVGVDFTKSNE
jgi:hypothetical protein